MSKKFFIMSNFDLFENLTEPNALTIATVKKLIKMNNYMFFLGISVFIMKIRNLQCLHDSKNNRRIKKGPSGIPQEIFLNFQFQIATSTVK